MTSPNAAHVRHTCQQVDTELYLPVGSQMLVGTQVLTLAMLQALATSLTNGNAFRGNGTPASIATAGAGSPSAANILTGTIVRDCAGASRVDTLPTAALMVAALTAAFGRAPAIGDSVDFLYVNGSDPVTEIITITEGSGGSWDTNQTAVSRTILGTCSKLIRMRFTGVALSSEAYVLYA